MSNEEIINLLNLISWDWDRLSRSGQSVASEMFDDLENGVPFTKFKKYLMDLCWDYDRMSSGLQQEMQYAAKQLGFEL